MQNVHFDFINVLQRFSYTPLSVSVDRRPILALYSSVTPVFDALVVQAVQLFAYGNELCGAESSRNQKYSGVFLDVLGRGTELTMNM